MMTINHKLNFQNKLILKKEFLICVLQKYEVATFYSNISKLLDFPFLYWLQKLLIHY